MSRNIFQGNSNTNNAFSSNNNSQSQNNIFTRNQQNSNNSNNNIFASQNNNNNNSNNIFQNNQGGNQGGQGNIQGNNIFSNNNQNQNNNIFNNRNSSNQGNNSFNNNQGNSNASNNIFNNQNNQQGNNVFSNNNQQSNNIFTNNNQQNNSLFNNNRQSNNSNIFNQNNQQNQMNNNNQVLFQQPLHYFIRFTSEQQVQLIQSLKTDQIRRFIQYCIKRIIEPAKLSTIALSEQNNLKYEKVNKLAARFNIKNQLIQIKKEVKDNVSNPIAILKRHNDAILRKQKQLSQKLSEKLMKLKQGLIEGVTQEKMIKDIKQQVEQIDNQIKDFLKPLYNSSQGRHSCPFIDPDPFCIKISQRILKNITILDNKMDELIACESQPPQQTINISNTIEQLIQYYENVALALRQFSERYNKIKKEELTKRRGNYEAGLDHIKRKASEKIDKQLKAYTLLKEIEQVLQQRSKNKFRL